MQSVVTVAIHASQFPENVGRDLLESLRTRSVNHKFHYDSVKQTRKWLALHQAYSPSRADENCRQVYDSSFASLARRVSAPDVHLIGLGCGGGQKDARLLSALKLQHKRVIYSPVDVSVAMVLIARQAALSEISAANCHPLVCDLMRADDLSAAFDRQSASQVPRIFSFLSMIPNFEAQIILPRLTRLAGHEDYLLLSANLAPGPDYAAGINRILPLYDNALTRDWLMTFLVDLGVESSDGQLRFTVEDCPVTTGLKRIAACFHFQQRRTLRVAGEFFEFCEGEAMQLFFSYRHTPERLTSLLSDHGFSVFDQWITDSGEEGVFLCRRA